MDVRSILEERSRAVNAALDEFLPSEDTFPEALQDILDSITLLDEVSPETQGSEDEDTQKGCIPPESSRSGNP